MVKKSLFYLILVFVLIGVLEGLSWVVYSLLYEDPYSQKTMQIQRQRVIAEPSKPFEMNEEQRRDIAATHRREAIHPYLGFVLDPEKMPFTRVNKYGFVGDLPPLDNSNHDDKFTIAVVGGSFAHDLAAGEGSKILVDKLTKSGNLNGKEPEIVNLALPGMKQPQQLFIINYFLSLGFHFDIILNIDGFNEIVLPVAENIKSGTNVFYPRAWRFRVSSRIGPEEMKAAGKLALKEDKRSSVADLFSKEPFIHSVTLNLIWSLLDTRFAQSIEKTRYEVTGILLNPTEKEKIIGSYAALGPTKKYLSESDAYHDLAAYWARSSQLIDIVSNYNDIHYFHVLQPNQYVEGSKVFNDEERKVALEGESEYRKPASDGYPFLIKQGKQIHSSGVKYTNLTMLFKGNDSILYKDNCCHLNEKGYKLVASEIADIVIQSIWPDL